MQLPYQQFFKLHGVRRIQTLLKPVVKPIKALPRSSTLHYSTGPDSDLDIPDLQILQGYSKRISIGFPSDLATTEGSPAKKSKPTKSLVRDFIASHKDFKYQEHVEELELDPFTLSVVNYNYLSKLYRYVKLPMTSFNSWLNRQHTIWSTIDKACDTTTRAQFIYLDIPKELPGISLLKMYSDKTNKAMLAVFDTDEKLMVLELWKWIDPNTRATSVLGDIKPTNLNRVNIVFKNDTGLATVLNLGYLNSWISDQENTTEFKSVTQYSHVEVGRFFLKFMISLESTNTPVEIPVESDVPAGTSDLVHEETAEEIQDLGTELEHVDTPSVDDVDEELKLLDAHNTKKLAERGLKVERDGELTDLGTADIVKTVNEVRAEVLTTGTPKSSIQEQLSATLDSGQINTGSYKKLLKSVEAYESMENPYDSTETMGTATNITKDMLAIDSDSTDIAASDLVPEESMKRSSLLSFHKDYVTKVLHKDVLSMVGGLQKAGIVITDHKVDIETSVLGTVENHTLKIKPIDGQPSVIKFKLPKIEEDGTFLSNGSKYVMRTQRVD